MAKCCVLHSDGSGTAAPRYARPNVLTAATKATKCGTKPSRAAKDDRKWNGRPILGVNVLKQPYDPQQVMAVMPAEIRATVNLYLDGKIRQWYSRSDGKGVVFLVEAKTEDEARAIMETLPLAKEQLMDDQYVPVGPLMPLRALMGPGAQQ